MKRSRSDDFPVARIGGKIDRGLANAFPSGRYVGEIGVGEAPTGWVDSGVEDSDDDVIGVVGSGPEAEVVGEVEEFGREGCVGVTGEVRDEGDDGRVTAEGGGFGGGETGGEAVEGGFVCVEELCWVDCGC